MTVLQFSRLFYPHIGGVEKHVLNLSLQLVESGHQVNIVTEQYDKSLPLHEEIKGISIYRIPISENESKKIIIWKWLLSNRNLIHKANVIHAHDVGFWYIPFRLLYPFKKFYITFHGYETVVPPRWQAIVVRKISEAFANGSMVIGEYIKKWYGARPDLILYGGVNVVKSSNLKVQSLNKEPRILFIGRIEEDNGIEVYAKVLEELKKKEFKFTFEAIGDGSQAAKFKKYGAMHGFVKDTDSYIQKADIIFASSYLSILESMIYKKPVISVYTNELKKDYLFLTPFSHWITISNSPKEISGKIISKKINTPNKAYEWVKEQTWENVSKKYLQLWKK